MMTECLDGRTPGQVTPAVPHGVLNVSKPAGWTSHDVVARIRRLLQVRKVGHAGTLDPEATGVLPVLLGQGTRLSVFLLHWDKEYEAVLCLGRETTTQDAAGGIVRECPVHGLSPETVHEAVAQFCGEQQQVPPMYSAVKIGGQPLYKAARAGKTVERQARSVTIYHIEILTLSLPYVTLRVRCSKGTYIRTLCADIGEVLGVGGHLSQLTRSRVGPFRLDQAWPLDDIGRVDDLFGHPGAFLSLDEALADLPAVVVEAAMVEKVLNGAPVLDAALWSEDYRETSVETLIRVKDDRGRLLALGKWAPSTSYSPKRQLRMVKVFAETSCPSHET
ncbi:MAG: tRNA pseudouridine(55) synthase TruB [Nitrospira sp. SB0677_bin_15]|nr:tRNA pseudouridine(55) synthase TruB [Nitrospira sp. SB0667_bin_9]MYD31875.1 tRNA pseudouridine(55) synthase TruB [Nitrospira sp. SB0661_bin_20]MYG39723.1 tRNA pseudouridine(55) synthase TruB [Nitrospira sp. SB0677_bin_15]MYH01989.1 tRNA pseudouridine(55) synthase TruB [Nitrospira sp. SB0675_bin_23]MYJ21794.1 tRNA pseudouridine(55) synthase TruB [Nitrospira sp. SB0673_bin_12]